MATEPEIHVPLSEFVLSIAERVGEAAGKADLGEAQYLRDFQITLADGSVYTPARGRLAVTADVTE